MTEIAARRWLCRGLAMVGATLLATTVHAQATDTVVPMPRWDVNGSVAVNNTLASEIRIDPGRYYDYWAGQWEPGAQIGRYLTPHLKLEIGVRGPMHYDFSEDGRVPVAALPGGFGPAPIDVRVRVFSVAPAITWQFLENSFFHPYVSAGLAMDVSDIRRLRDAGTRETFLTRGSVRYDVPAVDTRATEFHARPFLAAGSKSYFSNGRWFVRPEIQVGVAKSRIGQVSLRFGVGVDF
jgi:hypothetical protein